MLKEEQLIEQQRGHTYSSRQADEKLWALREQIAEATAPVRAFIPIDLFNEVETLVSQYRAEKVTHLTERAGARVEEYIDLPALNTWLAILALSLILGVGMSWSILRQRLSGQQTTDEVDG